MKKAYIILICCLFFSGCATTLTKKTEPPLPDTDVSGKGDVSSKYTEIVSSATNVYNIEVTPSGYIETLNKALIELNTSIKDERESGRTVVFDEKAFYSFYDLDSDGYPELLWCISNYRRSDIYIFTCKEDKLVLIDGVMESSITPTSEDYPVVDVYSFEDSEIILKTGWLDWSYNVYEFFIEYYRIADSKIKCFETPWYQWVDDNNEETNDEKDYYLKNPHIRKNAVSYDEFTEYCDSITKGFNKNATVPLDNYVEQYLQGDTLKNSLEKAYAEYQERLS